VAGGCANVGTIQIEPDALPKLLKHLLAQARVGTHGADLCTVETLFDALNESLVRRSADLRMRADNLFCVHDVLLLEG
jgi:hypothetical protein